MNQNKITQITRLILPVIERDNIHLVQVDLRGRPNNQVLRVFADTDQGITLEQITRLTRQINELLDLNDVIQGQYRLEVSSPGIDHDLTQPWEFRKNTGRSIKVKFETEDGSREVVGTLREVNEDQIILDTKAGDCRIELSAIRKARIQLKW